MPKSSPVRPRYGAAAWSRAATATELARIQVDTSELAAFGLQLEAWADRQFPFATAAALTDTARQARDDVRGRMSKHFKIRNEGVRRAVNFKAADKRDQEPEAIVHTEPWAEFLTFQVTGGVKRAKGGRVAVPTRIVRRGARGRISKPQKPRPLRERRGLEEGRLERGQIVVRGVKTAPPGLSIFYHLVRGARIEARWPFEPEVRAVVARELAGNFTRRLQQAIATARR